MLIINDMYHVSGIDALGPAFLIVMFIILLVLAILFFLWKKKIAEDLLREKGYDGTKKIGLLMFFMPVICWLYVIALPKKNSDL